MRSRAMSPILSAIQSLPRNLSDDPASALMRLPTQALWRPTNSVLSRYDHNHPLRLRPFTPPYPIGSKPTYHLERIVIFLILLISNLVIPVECEKDDDCGKSETCSEHHRCVDLCLQRNPCGRNAKCQMVNHQSTCLCLSGYQGDPRAECFPIGCRNDVECPDDKVCVTGQCWNPCLQTSCGNNARCLPRGHKANCECLPGYKGNPLVLCERG